ncbi:hypothetical protein DGI_0185 [Megalodesulfovibrio gigas DSM 1382 = ATCC 19364]|uniref:Uncharacterized protein n=2 Tax=Megalodesulfovibrio gigas TaxID=879 RepID=T2G8B9_MEGG1|nr:hypothetical protein DGI_0185 [Megalodesulfovibrio gigas DSM 1382 = ATCC 19364]
MLDYYLFKQVYDLFVENRFEEARSLLAELQSRFIEMADENEQLKVQLREFEDILYLARNVEFDGMSYWLKTGTVRQGPFCQTCFDRDGQLHRLQETPDLLVCPACNSQFALPHRPCRTFLERAPRTDPGSKVIQLYK